MSTSQSERQSWIQDIANQARAGGHIFPEYAASEAALESNWGQSKLAREANNLFGQKYRQGCPYGELDLPTQEFLNGQWVTITAHWIAYPDVATCFKDRMATLQRLQHAYPHYGLALNALNGSIYVTEVSATWSTDPTRAEKVLSIHNQYFGNNN